MNVWLNGLHSHAYSRLLVLFRRFFPQLTVLRIAVHHTAVWGSLLLPLPSLALERLQLPLPLKPKRWCRNFPILCYNVYQQSQAGMAERKDIQR